MSRCLGRISVNEKRKIIHCEKNEGRDGGRDDNDELIRDEGSCVDQLSLLKILRTSEIEPFEYIEGLTG